MGVFRMPSLGADMEAGILVEWLKKPGEAVKRGDIVAVVETQKGAIEVEIFEDGPITKLLAEPGARVPVGSPLALIGDATLEAEEAPVAPAAPLPHPAAPRPSATPPTASALASPAARKRASERGIDLAAIAGSGPDGAVTLADVERAEGGTGIPAPAERPPERPAGSAEAMRSAIAAAMARSKREIPHYYLWHSFDASPAKESLEAFNASQAPADRLLLGALLMKAVAIAIRDFPDFNGHYEAGVRKPVDHVHVGMAIAMRGGGLVAPAIHDTDRLAVPELMARMRDLVMRVRQGTFRSSEIADPTVTVSSLGDRGVEALFPIIYPPQVAIVGFGSLEQRPWLVGDAVLPRPVMTVSLGADHRVSDGHGGALFLRRIAALLSEPEAL